MKYVALALLLLAGCGKHEPAPAQREPQVPLERAAIAAGVIPDPLSADITGLYKRDTDRICIVPAAEDFRIGVTIAYYTGRGCDGAGRVARDGTVMHVDLGGGCRFDARFDGDLIAFPAQVPASCRALCHGSTSIAAMTVGQLSDSAAEAASMPDGKGGLPCG